MRLTVADLTSDSAGIAADCGLCLPADRARFLRLLNGAEERMLSYGRWWGSIVEAQFCVEEGCLIWPREVANIEQIAICGQPMALENAWYEFTQQLARIESCDGCCGSSSSLTATSSLDGVWPCGHLQTRMRARQACSFASTRGSNKVLRFYPTHSSDVGKTILVQGYDSNNIWVRTNPGSGVIDGELITLALPFVDMATLWYPGSPTALQKQATNYRVLMYEYDTVAASSRLLGDYQPSETNPLYRVSYIPSFDQIKCGNCCTDANKNKRTVTALVKLAHLPLSADQDWLLFQNLEAYREGMIAMDYYRQRDTLNGNAHMFGVAAPKQARMSNQATLSKGGAIPLLRAELRSMTGDNTTAFIHHENSYALQQALGGFR